MKILFVLHDLSLTGAPRIGIDMATTMAKDHDVRLVTKRDGPLRKLVRETGLDDVDIIRTSHEYGKSPLADRVVRYRAYLGDAAPDYVYVNSIASADWAAACRELGIPFALHGHEMRAEIRSLANGGVFRPSDVGFAQLIVSASEECARDMRSELRLDDRTIFDFGVGIDCAAIGIKAGGALPEAVNGQGHLLEWVGAGRRRVAMCGVACVRKGTDLFWEMASRCPDIDFLWIGPWDDEAARAVNPALTLNREKALPNLYWTNALANPYPALQASHLFMLSSREDPNPLVVPEAICLGLPVATFSDTGGSRVWTERFGFSMAGKVSATRMEAFVRRFFGQGTWMSSPSELFRNEADIRSRTKKLLDHLHENV